ncbi:hypothetical protein RHGRI_001921 [Rhododendron griersonianum]|uniref:Protein FAR1-RELATED SEQUENCE n=1 Tax=Rhododendron griersonianum TaxID=479676 RepID=A0AAV6LMY5_9ERIC|nr:hypothetical protein RHGRI_001921 [Rhododendron griersonianum]
MDAPNYENESEEAILMETFNDCNGELKVGMEVFWEDEAYNLYNEYALRKGFSIRRGNKRPDLNGILRQREYLCSKAGYRKIGSISEVKEFNHLETRTDCKARIRFTINNGIWTISHLNDDHNHELASPEERQNLRSGRKVLKAYGDVITSMVAAGIKPTQSYNYLSKEIRPDYVGFTKEDCYNYLHMGRENLIEAGNGQSVINFFKRKQVEDPMFFYSFQVDEKNRMANFFWRDGRSKLDYECFGDVIIFDTTYRTNKYNLVCAPFVGINHHWKNKLFGCAFLSNETTESFIWLFKTFLEAMGNRQPKSIFTDQDQAMANAIEVVFTGARHRLCMWHISNNAKQHLAGLFTNASFKALFDKCFYGCYDSIKFESDWADMVETFGLENHSWLKRLYDLREKWCPAFSVDFFSARMKSSQRSESTNSIFHQIMRKPMSLLQVIQYYEEKVEEMR